MVMMQKEESNEYLKIRKPQLGDGSAIYELVKASPPLDINSRYSYLLVCSHFDDTSAVVLDNEEIVGYISAYPHPHRDDTLFIWQVAVHPDFRHRGLAKSMIMNILGRNGLEKILYLEASVTPSNMVSKSFFKRLASHLGIPCQTSSFFPSNFFGETRHEEEWLLRMGPLNESTAFM